MARITFEVTQEQHTYIKMMAASKGISIRDYFLSQIERTIPVVDKKRPNRKTRKILDEVAKHQNINYTATIEDFYNQLELTEYKYSRTNNVISGLLKGVLIDKRSDSEDGSKSNTEEIFN